MNVVSYFIPGSSVEETNWTHKRVIVLVVSINNMGAISYAITTSIQVNAGVVTPVVSFNAVIPSIC